MSTRVSAAVVLCLGALRFLACVDSARAEQPELLVRVGDPVAASLIHRSVRGAAERLERPECRAVLAEFETPAGTPLADMLGRLDETPGQYLAGLLYLDGRDHPHCRSGAILAYTSPGWRVVFVCATEFTRSLARRPAEAEAVLIHEALHTLGLGENPPTPREIQDRVRARCTPGHGVRAATLLEQR